MSPPILDRISRRLPYVALVLSLIAALLRGIERALRPGSRAWNGAAGGIGLITLLLVLWILFHAVMLPQPDLPRLKDAASNIGQAVLAGIGLIIAVALIGRMPVRYRWTLLICGTFLTVALRVGDATLVAYIIVSASLAGAGIGVISGGGMRDLRPLRKAATVGGLAVGVAGLVVGLAWIASPGMDPLDMRDAAAESEAGPTLDLPDPATPGDYEVMTLTYGRGEDHRNEFGRDVDLITETVDGSPFITDWEDSRTDFWGLESDELPLQGRVWYPAGDGPFPLVLIVHGNHRMQEYSDPGYGYLGELWASRGIITVSVDENFINGSLRGENDARGWLLLEHLRQWQDWNEAEDNPFAGRVDMSSIGLIGHSRGGEAVGIAAAFNRLPYYPDDADVEFDYGFNLKAIIAIAPSYGQYRPGGKLTRLRDVNYMSIHGANDGDVTSFAGSAQYENVSFSGDGYHFKATVYVYGANHGQFNTVWGNNDWGMPYGRVLNRRALIPAEDQRQIGKVFMTAFLEAGLYDRHGYLGLFVDARRGSDWLPDTIYLTDFADSRSRYVATFEEDIDITTATLGGGRTYGENLSVWREDRLGLKFRDKETSAAYIGWYRETDDDDGAADDNADADADDDDDEASDEPDGDESVQVAHDSNNDESGAGEAASNGPSQNELVSDEAADDPGQDADESSDAPDPTAALPRYVIELPDDFDSSGTTELFFSLADAAESPDPDDDEDDEDEDADGSESTDSHDDEQGTDNDDQEHSGNDESNDNDSNDDESDDGSSDDDSSDDDSSDDDSEEDEPREPIDFTVRIVDAAGSTAELPLSRFSYLQPQLEVQIRKGLFEKAEKESEAVPQSFVFLLAWFTAVNPDLDTASLRRIELVFDRTDKAVIILDNVGLR